MTRGSSRSPGLVAGVSVIALALGSLSACSSGSDGAAAPKPAIATASGFDGRTITLGVLSSQTGPFAEEGKAIIAGNELYWKALNARGGVAGRYPVKLKVADTQYFESVAAIKYDEMHNDVAAFNQVYGTKSVIAVLPRLRRDRILAVPASDDGRWVYEPQLLPTGAPPEVEAANALAYWKTHGSGGTFCALHQDDTYSTAGYGGAESASTELGLPIAVAPTFVPLPASFGPQLDQLQATGCAAVLFIGLGFHAVPALTQAAARGFSPRWFLTSSAWSPSLAQNQDLASYLASKVWVVSNGANWGDNSVPGMKQLVTAYRRYGPDAQPGSDVIDGYLQSQALHQVLERAVKSGDLSREGLADAAAKVGTVRFDGLSSDYAYAARGSDRRPPRRSTIFAVDPEKPGALQAIDRAFTSAAADHVEIPAPPR